MRTAAVLIITITPYVAHSQTLANAGDGAPQIYTDNVGETARRSTDVRLIPGDQCVHVDEARVAVTTDMGDQDYELPFNTGSTEVYMRQLTVKSHNTCDHDVRAVLSLSWEGRGKAYGPVEFPHGSLCTMDVTSAINITEKRGESRSATLYQGINGVSEVEIQPSRITGNRGCLALTGGGDHGGGECPVTYTLQEAELNPTDSKWHTHVGQGDMGTITVMADESVGAGAYEGTATVSMTCS